MGTRSTIALEFADGTVEQVYCHWDGYLSHNGLILQEHYSDPFKLQELIEQGSISSLGNVIGKKHPFSSHTSAADKVEYEAAREAGYTTFHARDRGESLTVEKFENFAEYVENHQYEEFEYILRNVDGKATWFVDCGEGYVTLESAFNNCKEAA